MTQGGVTRLKIWLIIVGVFALGCVTGALLDSAYRLRASGEHREGRGERGTDDIFENMRRDLDLNERQATEIRRILDETRNEYRALRADVRPRYDSLRQNARTRIRQLLTPEQRQRFDAKAAERDAGREREDRRAP